MTRVPTIPLLSLALLGALTSACAHQRIFHDNGCWVKATESRWGDTRENISVCVPRPPAPSDDPLTRQVDACLYQARLGWYSDAIERLRTSSEPPSKFDWNGATASCLAAAEHVALERVDKLNGQIEGLEGHLRDLRQENRDLRTALISCAEKSPNAVAEAHSTSDSGSDAASSHKNKETTKRTAAVPTASRRRATGKKTAEVNPAVVGPCPVPIVPIGPVGPVAPIAPAPVPAQSVPAPRKQ